MPASPHQIHSLSTAGLNLIAQALTIYDADLSLAVSNAPFQQMFDLPDALVTPGATFEDTVRHLAKSGEYGDVTDVEDFVRERVDQARAFEPHYMERRRANGRIISVEGSPLPKGGWVTVYTDITRTKQQEALLRSRSEELLGQLLAYSEELATTNRELASMNAALEEAKRELTESEARVRLTTEMMPAHIAHVDAEWHYSYSNRRLSSVIPGRPSDILGLHIREALGLSAFTRILPNLTQAYKGQASVLEFTDDDSARRIRVAFTPDLRGGVYILSMDVTEETQARVALQQTRRRAMAAQLTSGLAHDFSNLLTIILGLQSKLGRTRDLPADAAPMIEGTIAAARRGGALLEGIAGVTAQRPLRLASVDPAALMRDLATLAQSTLPPGVHLDMSHKGPDCPILLDGGMVQDSLINLILNARDACGAQGRITVEMHSVYDTWVEWVVKDTGPGFSPQALDSAFAPFFTTKGSEGTGLGLVMVYDMTKMAGGDLRLGNGRDGAEVHLRLPYRPAIQSPEGLVLLVEDREDLRALYRDMLTGLGQSVVEATSVDEAMALLADLPEVTLVLSDVQLSGPVSGFDLARRMETNPVPIILMTSLPANDPRLSAASPLAPILHKPFDQTQLAALLGLPAMKETAP